MTADANIIVAIKGNVAGGKVIKRSLDDIDKSAQKVTSETERFDRQMQKTNKTAVLFGRALGAIGGTLAVRALGRINDEFTVVDTNIKNVTDSAEEYDRVFNSLFKTAQDNGDVFSGLASTYQKLNVSLEESVKQSIDLTKVTEILSRGFAASETSAQTAAGSSLQLTQGLATNFQAAGQELNSIIEGAPLLAKAIAVELGGKGATDLKRFAEEGELTAQTFLEALLAAEGAVKEFEIPPTIERSVQRVRNEFLRLTGQSETMRAVSVGVAEGFNFVAENLDTMFKIMAVGFGAFAGYIIATQGLAAAMSVASGAVAVFNAVVLANPLGLFIAALGAVGAAAYVFRDEIQATIIASVTEVILFVDKAIAKLTDLKNFATNGIAAASIGAQNFVGLIDDETAQGALLELGDAQRAGAGTRFNPEALRAEANAMIANLGNNERTDNGNIFSPTGLGGSRTNVSSKSGGGGRSRKSPIERISEETRELQRIIKETDTEQESLLKKIDDLTRLKGFAETAEEVQAVDRALAVANQELEKASTTVPNLKDGFEGLRDKVDEFGKSAGSAFGEIITGATDAKSAISDLLRNTASQLASEGFNGLVGGILNGFGGGGGLIGAITGSLGGGGGFLSGIGSLFGFNNGGDMMLGGNAGIDNNILSLNGSPIAKTGRGETMSIRPAGAGSAGNGGGVTVIQHINVSTGVQETVQAELVAFLPTIEKTTKAAIMQDKQRGIS